MRSNFGARGNPRQVPSSRYAPASRAPHASTAKLDASELNTPSAIYAQAEHLAKQLSASHSHPTAHAQRSVSGAANSAQSSSGPSTTLARVEHLAPYASGSSSSLFRTVLKTPTLTQVYIHGQFSSNATDVLRQFTAELRFFQIVKRHKNLVAFVGSLEGVGMLLEYIEGETLYKYLGRGLPMSIRADWFNQVLAGTCHIHSFGLAHNDLCSLNVVITQPPQTSKSQRTKYVVKLLDFGRSTVEPRPVPTPSPLAALRNAQDSMRARMALSTAQEDKERERKEKEKDLIYPGTRPFAAPEIMRAWTLSQTGSTSAQAVAEDEEEEDPSSDEDPALPPSQDGPSLPLYYLPHRNNELGPHPQNGAARNTASREGSGTPSTPSPNLDSRGPQSLRARLPLLAFSTPSPQSSSDLAPQESFRSRFAAGRHERSDAYPSPSSSSDASSSGNPFAHDDAGDVVTSEDGSPSRHRERRRRHHERRSRSRSRFDASPASHLNSSTNHLTQLNAAERKAQRAARHKQEIEALQSQDPHPISPILGDTYSLGVIALCLERDILVDISPGVQMREKWRPLDPQARDWLPIPAGQDGVTFFDGRFASKSNNLAHTSQIEQYMRPVRQRQRCKLDDALDVEAIQELERGWGISTPTRPSIPSTRRASTNTSRHTSNVANTLYDYDVDMS